MIIFKKEGKWKISLLIIYFFIYLMLPQLSLSQVFSSQPDPYFNLNLDRNVNKIVVDPRTNIVYIGGNFRRVNLEEIGASFPLNSINGEIVNNFVVVKPNGRINKIIKDNEGGWYVGGYFSYVFDPNTGSLIKRRNLIHILPNGLLDYNFNPDPDDAVTALFLHNNILYVGGYFKNIGNGINRKFRPRLAAIDRNGNPINGFIVSDIGNPLIQEIVVNSSTVFVSGNFNKIANATRTQIAAFDLNGNILPWQTPVIDSTLNFLGFQLSPFVWSLAISSTTLYAGGVFNKVGNSTTTFLAAFDINTGSLLPIDFQVDDIVHDLKIVSSTLYVAGSFENILGENRNYIAAIDIDNHTLLPFNIQPDNSVFSLEINSSTIYLGGKFQKINNVARPFLAAVDLASGSLMSWRPKEPNDIIGNIVANGNVIYVGGGRFSSLSGAGGLKKRCLIAVDGNTGEVLDWNPDLYLQTTGEPICNVSDLLLTTTTLYVGGQFEYAGNQQRKYLASFNINNGYPGNLTSWQPDPDSDVLTINRDDNNLYIGGYFNSVAGQERKKAASFSLESGIMNSWNPIASGSSVLAIEVNKNTGKIYLGGYFNSVKKDSQIYTRNNFAVVDSNGNIDNWFPDFDGPIYTLYINSSTLYTSGLFNNINGISRKGIASFNLTQNPPGLSSWYPSIESLETCYSSYLIEDFLATSSYLYFGNIFSKVNGQQRGGIVGFKLKNNNLLTFNPMFSNGLNENCYGKVMALAIGQNGLYVGGSFSMVNSSTVMNIVKFPIVNPPLILDLKLKDYQGNIYQTRNLPANTSEVTIEFSTDKQSICKYTNSPNIDYEDLSLLVPSFANNTVHRLTISNLNNNTAYNYYFKCQDLNNRDAVNLNDYQVSFSVGLLPPIISNIKLNSNYNNNSTLPANTTQVTLTFNTDKNSICRYETTANISFDNMTNFINTNDGFSHSVTFFNLQNNTTYTYYLKCQDRSNPDLKNTQDYIVSFSIAQAQTGSGGTGGSRGGGGGGGGGGSSSGRITTSTITSTTSDEALRSWLLQFVMTNLLSQQKQTKTTPTPLKQTKTTPTSFKSRIKGIPDGFQFTRTLKLGMKGQDVRYLQIFLKSQGKNIYPEGKITGVFTNSTKKAVIRFQEKYKKELKIKKADGIVRGTTLTKINKMIRGK